ncbi:hypothetical protein FALBO_9592 [Fusarium albosuccineum]|uniref:Uncharacterized protein n=1 Tax=Fusarium albosuccineum TaxID=1237068 RepID=A0A8H4L8L4_9HYPO|nr:hypothetical protein FALBO_9592 [Fusarium albosuccineum]KAF5004227.1 hypothetical protein FDECE_9256 [Fusarium decemcellulare]
MHARYLSIIAAFMASSVAAVRIEHTGLAGGGGGGATSCIPTCSVYVEGERGCNGRAEFVGSCNEQDGDQVKDVGGCSGVNVRWVATGGEGTLEVRDANGFDSFKVENCEAPVTTSIRCTFDKGCAANKA